MGRLSVGLITEEENSIADTTIVTTTVQRERHCKRYIHTCMYVKEKERNYLMAEHIVVVLESEFNGPLQEAVKT